MQLQSFKPQKQRKFRFQAPMHVLRKNVSAHLAKDLRQKYKKRAIELRTGDIVKVMTGNHKGKTGKVTELDYLRGLAFIEKVTLKKSDGSDAQVPLHASNLMITALETKDKRRIQKPAKEKKEFIKREAQKTGKVKRKTPKKKTPKKVREAGKPHPAKIKLPSRLKKSTKKFKLKKGKNDSRIASATRKHKVKKKTARKAGKKTQKSTHRKKRREARKVKVRKVKK